MELNIRVKHPENLPFLGHFLDPVDLSKAVLPLTMQLESEQIEEDPEESHVTKDAEFYRQKAKRRRIFYSKKKVMMLQDGLERKEGAAPAGGIQYEGHPWMPPQASVTGDVVSMDVRSINAKATGDERDAINNYAVLQVVKRKGGDGKETTEVNLIPVGGFYNFRKPAMNKAQTLELIDDEFEAEIARRRRSHARYQAFVMKPVDVDDEGEEVVDPKSKKPRIARPVEQDDDGDRVDKNGKFQLPAVFGMALQARGKLKKGANQKQYLNESGVALDQAEQALDLYQGEYEKEYSHNDMAFADEGQNFAQQNEEAAFEQDRARDDFQEEEESGDEEEEEDEEDDEAGNKKHEPKVSGLVDDEALLQARKANKAMEALERSAAQRAIKEDLEDHTGAAGAGAGAAGSKKRPRSSDSGEDVKEEPGRSEEAGEAGEGSRGGAELAMTDKSIREFVSAHGGKVSLDELKLAFRKQVKAMNKAAANSGVAAISDIIKRLCKVSQDVILGKVVSLK